MRKRSQCRRGATAPAGLVKERERHAGRRPHALSCGRAPGLERTADTGVHRLDDAIFGAGVNDVGVRDAHPLSEPALGEAVHAFDEAQNLRRIPEQQRARMM